MGGWFGHVVGVVTGVVVGVVKAVVVGGGVMLRASMISCVFA